MIKKAMFIPPKKERRKQNKEKAFKKRKGGPPIYVVYYGREKQQHKKLNRIEGERKIIRARLAELDLISWYDYKMYKLLPNGLELATKGFSEKELLKMMYYKKKRYRKAKGG